MHIHVPASGAVLFCHLVKIVGGVKQGKIRRSSAAAVSSGGGKLVGEDHCDEYQKNYQYNESDAVF